MCTKPFSWTKNKGKLCPVAKSSGPLFAGLPLKAFERKQSLGVPDLVHSYEFSCKLNCMNFVTLSRLRVTDGLVLLQFLHALRPRLVTTL